MAVESSAALRTIRGVRRAESAGVITKSVYRWLRSLPLTVERLLAQGGQDVIKPLAGDQPAGVSTQGGGTAHG